MTSVPTLLPQQRKNNVGTMQARDFETLMEAVRLPALLVDRSGGILASNPAARISFGEMPAGTLFYLKFRMPEVRQAIDAAFKSQSPTNCDYSVRVPTQRWFRLEVTPIKGPDMPDACFLLFQDISETRKIDQMRADFVANASHELRTPLASLLGFIETLRGPARNDATAREKFLSIMQEQANRMSRLIDDLLSLSRLEMRPFAQLTDQVDITALVREMLDSLSPLAREAGVKIEQELPNRPIIISGIKDELQQAIENLVENACKYGKSGGRVIVRLGADPMSGDMVFSVRDFGPGIEQAHIPRLTERFYRADSGNNPSLKGTGLGLAIVKHIVSRHNGQLGIQSTPGEGATFTIRLPNTE